MSRVFLGKKLYIYENSDFRKKIVMRFLEQQCVFLWNFWVQGRLVLRFFWPKINPIIFIIFFKHM